MFRIRNEEKTRWLYERGGRKAGMPGGGFYVSACAYHWSGREDSTVSTTEPRIYWDKKKMFEGVRNFLFVFVDVTLSGKCNYTSRNLFTTEDYISNRRTHRNNAGASVIDNSIGQRIQKYIYVILWSERQGRQDLQSILSFDQADSFCPASISTLTQFLPQTKLLFMTQSYLKVVFVPISPNRFRDSSSVWMFSVCARMRTICTISSCE